MDHGPTSGLWDRPFVCENLFLSSIIVRKTVIHTTFMNFRHQNVNQAQKIKEQFPRTPSRIFLANYLTINISGQTTIGDNKCGINTHRSRQEILEVESSETAQSRFSIQSKYMSAHTSDDHIIYVNDSQRQTRTEQIGPIKRIKSRFHIVMPARTESTRYEPPIRCTKRALCIE